MEASLIMAGIGIFLEIILVFLLIFLAGSPQRKKSDEKIIFDLGRIKSQIEENTRY